MHGASAFSARVNPSRPERQFQNLIKELFFILKYLSEVLMGME
jgi:hypothetical protein